VILGIFAMSKEKKPTRLMLVRSTAGLISSAAFVLVTLMFGTVNAPDNLQSRKFVQHPHTSWVTFDATAGGKVQ